MKLAVIGSRQGADLEHVISFLASLRESQPDIVLVSGGAEGVDSTAEQTWLSLGGQVISFRAKRFADEGFDEVYGVERWDLGTDDPLCVDLIHEPTFADYVSALKYRDMLIAQECTRLVSFQKLGGSRGSSFTAEVAEVAEGKPVFRFEPAG